MKKIVLVKEIDWGVWRQIYTNTPTSAGREG